MECFLLQRNVCVIDLFRPSQVLFHAGVITWISWIFQTRSRCNGDCVLMKIIINLLALEVEDHEKIGTRLCLNLQRSDAIEPHHICLRIS